MPAIAARATREISRTELSRHCTVDDMWLAVHGGVYDVTHFHARHPGGVVIVEYAGIDATDQFELFHSPTVAPHLRPFLIGRLVDDAPCDAPGDAPAGAGDAPASAGADAGAGAAVGSEVVVKPLHHGLLHDPCSAADIAAAAAADADPCTLEYRELRRQLWEEGAFELTLTLTLTLTPTPTLTLTLTPTLTLTLTLTLTRRAPSSRARPSTRSSRLG